VLVNRAPVLTLWAAVVAEVLGFEHDKALTVDLLHRAVPAKHTDEGLRALSWNR
jgi:hypothetical protein